MKHRGAGSRMFDGLNLLFLVFLMVVTLYPFWHIVAASLSLPHALVQHRGLIFLPLGGASLQAYTNVIFNNPMIAIGYLNTVVYVIGGTCVNVVLTSLGAYGLSRKNVKLASPLMFLITFTMLFSGGLIPTFLLVRDLRWINTRWAILIPNAVSVYNLIIMRTGFKSVPDSMEESARMDGAGDLAILLRIVLPLSTAVLAVMILFYSVWHWNSWFWALVYLRERELYPLQLVLREILVANVTESMTTGASAGDREPIGITIQYATIIVSTVPILFAYPFLQRYFVKGVMVGAIKG
jgi:putative aldouronate transport system permease protein